MHVVHISAECYPMAKVGGLADVVGSLPKYLNQAGVMASVVIPAYEMPWYDGKAYRIVHQGYFHLGQEYLYFEVRRFEGDPTGFPFYTIQIPTKFDRFGVYAGKDGVFFGDEVERYIAFQRAFLTWIRDGEMKPDVIHCHDHHTGLVPFFLKYAYEFQSLAAVPTVFTIHNERYQGAFIWARQYLLPHFDNWKSGLLDWNHMINPLACAVRCAWKVTTVSPNYMRELMYHSFGLESLFQAESWKCTGILNGIDSEVWNPATDPMIDVHFEGDAAAYKSANKSKLCAAAGLHPHLPLVSFIGRLVHEKGAEMIAGVIDTWLSHHLNATFVILGTGDKGVEAAIHKVTERYPGYVASMLTYNETLSHKIYASSDFLLMPSRVEPCGLNQMFAMRYVTLPIVRNTGGLHDSVLDITQPGGVGIRFDEMEFDQIMHALWRAMEMVQNDDFRLQCIERAMSLDFSWHVSAQKYAQIYHEVLQNS
ncbi:MAG: glycogen synthase [Saprospiraceae bacterium]|nr:glycogen synthase [Saprospiraceae bacterium]